VGACLRDELAASLSRRDYIPLKDVLSRQEAASLAEVWTDFRPMERLLLFKLLAPAAALELFTILPFEEGYRLFGGSDRGAAAPALEGLPAETAAAFVELSGEVRRALLDSLLERAS